MPSILLNNTLSALSSGVTQQYQEGRFDSQVNEMINCIPSLTRGVLRRNPLLLVNNLTSLPSDISSSFVYSYDRGTTGEQYIVVIPGDSTMRVYNANTGALLYSTTSSYLLSGSVEARKAFKAITLGDHTFIVNTIKTVLMDTTKVATSRGYSDMAFYWIKKTTSVVERQSQTTTGTTVSSGTLAKGYTYRLNGAIVEAEVDTRPAPLYSFPPAPPLTNFNTAPLIAAKFRDYGNPSGVYQAEDSVCYNSNFTGNSWRWDDSFGQEASLGVWTTIDSATKLPVELPSALNGFIVKVSGSTSGAYDDFYLKYSYTERTWKECSKPGSYTNLNVLTMPHVLYRISNGTFRFDTYKKVPTVDTSAAAWSTAPSEWVTRTSGGGDTLQDPSFIGKTISNIFFHKNRLGFLTKDSVILSRTGDYGAFFSQTLQEVLDNDPIDLAVASTNVTVLRHAVPTAGQLLLFADDTQFSLDSLEGPLTPKSADIIALSNYTYGEEAQAEAVGNKVYFTNQAGGYSQMYAYSITDQGSKLTEANQLTIHLPTYIDSSASRIIGHDVLGYIFIQQSTTPKDLVVLSNVYKQGKDLQNSFHKWRFTKNIVSTHIINNDLYIVFSDGTLSKMSLEVPGDINDVVYNDTYTTPGDYTSYLEFSEFFVRDQQGKGTVRGRLQLRTLEYTVSDDSRYVTNIFNTDQVVENPDVYFGPLWDDTLVWSDNLRWIDNSLVYSREYIDDSKVTVLSNSKYARITFKSSTVAPSKGFELATANIEAFQHQRSARK